MGIICVVCIPLVELDIVYVTWTIFPNDCSLFLYAHALPFYIETQMLSSQGKCYSHKVNAIVTR